MRLGLHIFFVGTCTCLQTVARTFPHDDERHTESEPAVENIINPNAAAPAAPAPAAHPPPAAPVIAPRVNSEGHQKICSLLLPVLFTVMMDSFWCARSPRDQVREACDSFVA